MASTTCEVDHDGEEDDAPRHDDRCVRRLEFDENGDLVGGLMRDDVDIDVASLGKLGALSGVREFPARVKCASLCWHTLDAALHRHDQVSTE